MNYLINKLISRKTELIKSADFLYFNGILSSKDEQVYWIFSESRFMSILGLMQLFAVSIKILIQFLTGSVRIPTIINHDVEDKNAKSCIIWPSETWGGFQREFIPTSIIYNEFNVVVWGSKTKHLNYRDTFKRIYLGVLLLKYVVRINKINDRLAFVVWSFSNQPLFLVKSRSMLVVHSAITQPLLKSVYFPFEFYPEARLIYSIAADLNLNSVTAQHMKWTAKKLSNFSSKSSGVWLPKTLYVSQTQACDLLTEFAEEVIRESKIGRFDILLGKENKIMIDGTVKVIQVLCSGTPFDIMRGIEFSKRIRDNRPNILLVLHPKTSKALLLIARLICLSYKIKISVGFKGYVSPELPIFTCGTSLIASLKRAGVRVKNIGGEASQF